MVYQVIENKGFIGRVAEQRKIEEIMAQSEPQILIAYGRRRIGKTELLEQCFRKRNLLKFEGIEGRPQEYQRKIVMQQLADYAEQPLLREIKTENWIDVFKHIHNLVTKGVWTIYFEELQWLADYQNEFISELKYIWDNFWRNNKKIIVILCGSSPSFMINMVAHSKALYNRSQHELPIHEFNLLETKALLKKSSLREVMDAQLTVGGIPAYLLYLKQRSSVFLSLCYHSFTKASYFSKEYERIFISTLAKNPNYQKIIEFLGKQRFATRNEILNHLKEKSGGRISELIEDLELCGFISSYTPVHLDKNSKLVRYCIQDNYLQFYFKFIKPITTEIEQGVYDKNLNSALKSETYYKWLGFAFERFCRRYHYVIANILKFGAVRYRSGVYFSRQTTQEDDHFQIDLMFDRDDNVITICEIKYLLEPATKNVIKEFQRKLDFFPNQKKKQIHKVLIASNGAVPSVVETGYFDNIVSLNEIFNEVYW